MNGSGNFLKSSAMALMLLSTIITWMLTGMVTANEKCMHETGSYFGKCLDEAYMNAGLQPEPDPQKGDEALSVLIFNKTTSLKGCEAKWHVAFCVIKNLCNAKDTMCTYNDVKLFEEQFKKELLPFVVPCNWDYTKLEVTNCTKDAWDAAHGISTTEAVDIFTSTAFSENATSTSSVNQSTSAAPVNITTEQNSTVASSAGSFNTTVSIIAGSATTGTSNTSSTAAPSEHSSSKKTSEHAHTGNSIIDDLQQTEVLFIGVSCLVMVLFCCIFCCFCASN